MSKPEQAMDETVSEETEDTDDAGSLDDDVLLEEMVKAIVTHTGSVKVTCNMDGERKDMIISVHPEDVGKCIGKQGRVIKILSDFMGTVGFRNGYPITVRVDGDTNYFRKIPGWASAGPNPGGPGPGPQQQPYYQPGPQQPYYPPRYQQSYGQRTEVQYQRPPNGYRPRRPGP